VIFLTDPDTAIDVPFDWTDSVGNGITLTSVVHTVPAGLTKGVESTDTAASLSKVRVSGGTSGVLYVTEANATLSTGEVITKRAPVRVVAG
jgi:hypothetical protein